MAAIPFTVATHNALYKLSTDQIEDDIAKTIRNGAEIIGLQELGGDADRKAIRRFEGWDAADTGNFQKDPIMWKKSVWTFIEKFSKQINPPTKVNEGAGPENVPAKYVVGVRLRHNRTKVAITFLNIHFTPSAMAGGTPRNNARGDLIKVQVQNTAEMIHERQKRGEIVILTGDLNIDYPGDARDRHPSMPYKKWGLDLNCWPTYRTIGVPNEGSHGKRHIDWICCTKRDSVIRPHHHKMVDIRSDHDSVVATFHLVGDGANASGPDPDPVVPEDPAVDYNPAPWHGEAVEAETVYPGQCV